MAQPHRSRVVRGTFIVLGFVSVGLGTAGVVLPVLPTTPFILLAAFFFARSSPRFDAWLVNHRLFGSLVRDWRAGRGLSVRAKTISLAAIALTFTITIVFAIDAAWLRVLLVMIAVSVSTYLIRLPTKPRRAAVTS